MKSMMDVISEHFDSQDVKYQQTDSGRLRAGFKLTNSSYTVFVHPDEGNRRVVLVTTMASNVPEPKRAAAAEFIARANLHFAVGGFDLDFSDGQMVFRVGVIVADGQLTGGMVWEALALALTTMDTYHPGIMQIIHAGVSPADAVAAMRSEPVGSGAMQL